MFKFPETDDIFGILKTVRAAEALRKLPPGTRARRPGGAVGATRLFETQSFGTNPGQLRMFSYLPLPPTERSALVVVLHGCGQTAAGYDHGTGWSTLADRYGFSLLMPEQQRSNNPNGCFNWFQPQDTQRDRGEAASIRQMVETMVRENNIDPHRVYVTGLSAGGAMTSVMLACYPETFAAGAIIAGLPHGAASNVRQAFQSMFQCPSRPAKDWGDLVRAAAPRHAGTWPRVSVWHGSADKTVIPSNAREIIKQWTDVHGLSDTPSKHVTVEDYPRQVWLNGTGGEIVESYTITHMAHGTPLATGDADFECGAAGPFHLEVGISSSFHIAKFFDLTLGSARAASLELRQSRRPDASSSKRPKLIPPAILGGEILNDAGAEDAQPRPPRPLIDIDTVITKALESAGLIARS